MNQHPNCHFFERTDFRGRLQTEEALQSRHQSNQQVVPAKKYQAAATRQAIRRRSEGIDTGFGVLETGGCRARSRRNPLGSRLV